MEAIKKKKECNAKAQVVVEKLLDPIDDEKELLIMVSSTRLVCAPSP